jgi:phosphatidylglycerophosphate synthase
MRKGKQMRFNGDKKVGASLLANAENKLKAWLLPMVPKKCETYHLTLSTLVWCALIIVFSFFARFNIQWMWGVSLMIFLQYITDLLDGAIGRERNTGLIKWGFYMDHLLDYLFLCSIVIGYTLLLKDHYKYMQLYVLALFGAFMVNSFLSFAATNEFRISYGGIGPTEVRLVFIIINTLLVVFGTTHIAPVLPYVLAGSAFGLFVTVYKTSKALWALDMENKANAEKAE